MLNLQTSCVFCLVSIFQMQVEGTAEIPKRSMQSAKKTTVDIFIQNTIQYQLRAKTAITQPPPPALNPPTSLYTLTTVPPLYRVRPQIATIPSMLLGDIILLLSQRPPLLPLALLSHLTALPRGHPAPPRLKTPVKVK